MEFKYWRAVAMMLGAQIASAGSKAVEEVGVGVASALNTLSESLFHRAMKTSDEIVVEEMPPKDMN